MPQIDAGDNPDGNIRTEGVFEGVDVGRHRITDDKRNDRTLMKLYQGQCPGQSEPTNGSPSADLMGCSWTQHTCNE